MKIGLVLPGFSAAEGDWCIPALLNFVRRLAAEHTVHVFALEYPFRRSVYPIYGATVHSMGGRNLGKRYTPRLWSDTLAAIYAEHRRGRFDLLHAFWINEPGAIATLAGRVLRVPVIASIGGGELSAIPRIGYGGQLRMIERAMVLFTWRVADQVTTGSRYLRGKAARWRPDAGIYPLGVDAGKFSHGPKPDAPAVILNVGSLVPVKGHLQLLNALAQIEMPETCLEIIGGGPLERELREHVKRLGIAGRVTFSGALSHDELASRYRNAGLFVQSSLHEAQGMAVLEAAACGVPVAGTPVGVVPELAEANAGIVARGFRAEDLAAAMAAALETRRELGQQARPVVEQRYTLEATWNGWMELYHYARRA